MPEGESGTEVPKEMSQEAPISEWGISRVEQRLVEIKELKNKSEKPLPEEEMEKLLNEIGQLNARKKEFSVGLREATNIARLVKDGTLRDADIERAFKRIEQAHPDDIELQEANFDLVRVEYAKLERMAREEAKEEARVETPETVEGRQKEVEELTRRIAEGDRSPETIAKLIGAQNRLWRTQQEMAVGGLISGMERPPEVEKNVDNFRTWFKDKIHALIEEYPDQSFETNWTLVYPLQQAVNSLWPKKEGEDVVLDGKGVEFSYSGLRKELALELESHRNLHNYIFLHRRVGGVEGVVTASALLESRYLEYLMNKTEVASVLKKLEGLGEDYKKSKNRVFEEKLEKADKAAEESNQKRIFNEMSNLQRKDWAGIVAGGLYSALHEAARHDIIFNESGDFFLSRVFNMPDRVKDLWEKWGRDPNPAFYNALDLGVSGFWATVLERQYNFFKMQSELKLKGKTEKEIENATLEKFKVFCKRFNIIPTKKTPKGKEDYSSIKDGYYSLKSADFRHIKLTGKQAANCLGTRTDEVKVVDLELMDADEIRKLILNPGCLVERPGLDHIKEIWRPFKHLKGKKRSDWFRRVIKQIILLFKDQRAPDIENLPEKLRDCPAKKIYPGVSAWLNPQIVLAVKNLAPPLTKEDADKLLSEVVGPKPVREAKEYGKAAISAAGAMISEFTKALLGLNK